MSRSPLHFPASALDSAGKLHGPRMLARILAVAAFLVVVALPLTPWQQSVPGAGRVIAYAPLERRQTVEAPMPGRVVHWYVQEGDVVEKGEPIADLADNDPEILDRLRREQAAAQAQVDAASLSITLTQSRLTSMEAARESAIANAKLQVRMASQRREAALRSVDAAQSRLRTAERNLERQQGLLKKGLASERDMELALLEQETAHTELDRATASLKAATSEVKALTAEQSYVSSTNQASIEATGSSLEQLRADKAKAEGELAKVQVRLARQNQMKVVAPRAGTILRLIANQGTEMVKAGDALVELVPEAGARAVELYVDGNDAPLVDPGREVRLQFEGWPAVQFVGWPSVAVGTFGGTVAFVDSHDDGQGRFRVVVVPHEDSPPWPSARYLRQGVRVNGWILLNRVSLGFELWRQFNAFPPVVKLDESPDKSTASATSEQEDL